VCVAADDRLGLERLLRHCAHPAFALETLREIDPQRLIYESGKPGPGPSLSLLPTAFELIDRLAALIPPPRRHRQRYNGVLAPACPALGVHGVGACGSRPLGAVVAPLAIAPSVSVEKEEDPQEEPIDRRAARYAWALLPARVYEVFPHLCLTRGAEMWINAFIPEAPTVRDIPAPG